MADRWKDEGQEKSSFKSAKKLIVDEIAKNALLASKAQQFDVLLASEPEDKLFSERLSDQSLTRLADALAPLGQGAAHRPARRHQAGPGPVRRRPAGTKNPLPGERLPAVRLGGPAGRAGAAGAEAAGRAGDARQVRRRRRPAAPRGPARPALREPGHRPAQPQFRVVARNMPPTLFTVTVANYGITERQNVQVRVRLNGRDEAGSSVRPRSSRRARRSTPSSRSTSTRSASTRSRPTSTPTRTTSSATPACRSTTPATPPSRSATPCRSCSSTATRPPAAARAATAST